MKFKKEFIEHYSRITEWDAFERCLLKPRRRSIRVNTLKIKVADLVSKLSHAWCLEQVPWCCEGFWISERENLKEKEENYTGNSNSNLTGIKSLGSIEEHKMGLFYIQEAASMIPAIVVDPKPGENILDMCASPGSKTTQIAQYMENTGSITANDIRDDRIAILKRNIERMGVENCRITKMPGQRLKDLKFDRILLDPPCSATGTMRGRQDMIEGWNPDVAARMQYEQRSLIHYAYCVLRRGGILVYSTCSIEVEENEAVVDWLLKRHKKIEIEQIKMNKKTCALNRSDPILEYEDKRYDERVGDCMRLMPHDNDTDGFFIARLKKI